MQPPHLNRFVAILKDEAINKPGRDFSSFHSFLIERNYSFSAINVKKKVLTK